jgi:hypothetical protein
VQRILDEPDEIESFEDDDDLLDAETAVAQPPKKKAATGSHGQSSIAAFFGKLPLGVCPLCISQAQ